MSNASEEDLRAREVAHMLPILKRSVVLSTIICFFWCNFFVALAQDNNEIFPEAMAQKPQVPMENVFYNVLWGSLTGGMLMMGWAMLDDAKSSDERYTLNHASTQFLSGATYGGLLGLAAGVYISMKNISFDESRLKITFLQPSQVSGTTPFPQNVAASNLDLVQMRFSF